MFVKSMTIHVIGKSFDNLVAATTVTESKGNSELFFISFGQIKDEFQISLRRATKGFDLDKPF